MKNLNWLILVLFFAGCMNRKAEQEREIAEDYRLVERTEAVAFEYSPEFVADKTDSDLFHEIYFAGQLLKLFDPSLTEYHYQVTRSSETISSADGDTISFDVYDFSGEAGRQILASHFADSMYVDKFIGVLKPPYRGLYLMNDTNLCVVVRPGLQPKRGLKDKSFRKFIAREKANRVKAAKALK